MQNAEDAVGIAHTGNLGIGGYDGFVGKIQCHQRALFDTGGRIADDEFKTHLAGQRVQYFFHAFFGQRVFVACLRGRQDEQFVAMFVFNQSLVEGGFPLDDVDQVVYHAAFAAHNQIQVAQADVEVDNGGFMAAECQTGSNARTGGGFTHTAFA